MTVPSDPQIEALGPPKEATTSISATTSEDLPAFPVIGVASAEMPRPLEGVGVSPNSDSLLRSLLEQMAEAVGAQMGTGLVLDPAGDTLTCRAVYRLPTDRMGDLAFKIGQGNTGKVALSGEPLRMRPAVLPGGFKSSPLLIVPVFARGEVAAVINLTGTAAPEGFSSVDEEKALALAAEAAPALARVLAAERERGNSETVQLSDLLPTRLLKEVQDGFSNLLRAPCAFEDPHGRCILPISNAPDFCVLMRSKPEAALQCEFSMAQAGSRAEDGGQCGYVCHAGVQTLVTPIFARGRFIGSLVVMLRYDARDATAVRTRATELGLDAYETLAKASLFPTLVAEAEPSARFLANIVTGLIGAIAEERLNVMEEQERVKQTTQEMSSLRRLSQTLGGVIDLDLVCKELVRAAVNLSGGVAADITLMGPDGRLQLRAHAGLTAETVNLLTPALADSPAARAISIRRPYTVDSIAVDRQFPAWSHAARRQGNLGSAYTLVLGAQDRPFGALTVYRSEGVPDVSSIQLLAALGDRASLAVQSALATGQARANEQALRSFLARMARGLSSSLDRDQLVQWVADFVAEMTGAPHCVVYEVVGDELQIRAMNRTGRTVIEKPTLRVGEGLSGEVAARRTMLQTPDIRRDPRFVTSAAAIPPDADRYVGVPLLVKNEIVGVLAVYTQGQVQSDEDLQLLISFAGQAGAAIQNARAYEHQKAFATTMQQSFLPRERIRIEGLEVGELYETASEDDVGGDYYDFLTLGPKQAAIILGDVSGKGIKAATYTAMGKYVLRAYAFENPRPEDVLYRMNNLMASQMEPGIFITLFYVLVDLGAMVLHYANAGHPDGLLYQSRTKSFTHLPSTGMMIGAMSGETFSSTKIQLESGDLLVLYTDGVIEARHGEDLFGLQRLSMTIAEYAHLPAKEMARAIHDRVAKFQGRGLSDDTCILVLRFSG